ncbi:MAG: DUF5681 domain-containing protein [Burkholderiaceae bacterium]
MTTTKKAPGRPWPKGVSGNPSGKPKGARHRVTVALEKLMQTDAQTIVRAVLAAAAGGDMSAARMVLDRVAPPAKDRHVSLDLPDTSTAEGIEQAQGAIVAAVAGGHMLPSEGVALSGLVEARRRSLETNELAARIAALELKGTAK